MSVPWGWADPEDDQPETCVECGRYFASTDDGWPWCSTECADKDDAR